MSIFQKNCPECASPNSTDAITCNCGHVFDPDALASADPTEYAQQQDRLYRDYLEARVAQAEAELTVAREMANADPESTYKASSALLAEQSLNTLKAEMKQLSLRVRATPSPKPAPAAKRQISPPSKPAPVKVATPRLNVVQEAPKATAPRPRPAMPSKAPVPTTAIKAETKVLPAPAAKPVANISAAVPETRRQLESTRVNTTTSQVRAPRTPIAPPPINGKNHKTNPAITAQPSERFKQLQTQKAETIARTKPVTPPPPPRAPAKTVSQPAAADIPPVVLRKSEPTQECPNCTATVAAASERCSCGYLLCRPGEEVPALALDAGALAILTEGISFNSSNRRR